LKQVVQAVRTGELKVIDVPMPAAGPTEVLVATTHTLLSPGTERTARQLASASLLAKARARPELVRQVFRKARVDGVRETMRAVQSRLDEDMPLGYSGAGEVMQIGEAAIGLVPGQRVATAGTGKANHAEFQVVSANLAVAIPEGVANEEAAFSAIAAVALHGLHLAELQPGSKVCVIGLGLLGQLAVRIAGAAGHEIAAIDLRKWAVDRSTQAGAFGMVELGDETTSRILDWSRGRGVDAVIVAAATPSSGPVRRAAAIARDRATVVIVGDVGLQLERTAFYNKELTLRVARSYGPGRYDPTYEDWAVDYPVGYVRWTEGRNIEAVLDLIATRRLQVRDLITHTYPVDDAGKAYKLIGQSDEPFLGVQLTYAPSAPAAEPPKARARRVGGGGIGLLGAGSFARTTLVPALKRAGFRDFVSVASVSGVSASRLAKDAGFERASSTADELINDPDIEVIVIATPHDTHAGLVVKALTAGKHVFCEKPLAVTGDELSSVAEAWRTHQGQLFVGFNRRYASQIITLANHFAGKPGPLLLTYRVSAGRVADGHWYTDRRQGGRIIGEVCHFIDTCSAIVGAPLTTVFASGQSQRELLLTEDVVVLLAYEDGSVASISYGSAAHPRTTKERLEVLGRGHSAVIDDFRRLTLDEKVSGTSGKDKGHWAEIEAFREAITSSKSEASTLAAFQTMAATFAAVESLKTGSAVRPANY